jgi:hypothetical protein
VTEQASAQKMCGEGDGAPDTIRTCGLHLRRVALYPAELRAHFTSLNPIDPRRSTDSVTFDRACHCKRLTRRVGARCATRLFAAALRNLLTRCLRDAYAENFPDLAACRQTLNLRNFSAFFLFLPNERPLTSAFGGQRSIQLSYGRLSAYALLKPLHYSARSRNFPLRRQRCELSTAIKD